MCFPGKRLFDWTAAHQTNFDENMSQTVVLDTVSADGLAPLVARPSADTVMTTFKSHVHTWVVVVTLVTSLYVIAHWCLWARQFLLDSLKNLILFEIAILFWCERDLEIYKTYDFKTVASYNWLGV